VARDSIAPEPTEPGGQSSDDEWGGDHHEPGIELGFLDDRQRREDYEERQFRGVSTGATQEMQEMPSRDLSVRQACACWCAPEARLAVAAVAQCALEKGRARTSRCSTRAPVAPLGQRGSARGRGMSLLCV
jgi:hypothetical protein